MSDFGRPRGFEDDWSSRRLAGRQPATGAKSLSALGLRRDQLARVVTGAREVMVSVTGAVQSRPQLVRHLDYISRQGRLALEDQDGFQLNGRAALKDLAEDWNGLSEADSLRRPNSPIARTLVFSMPPGTDGQALEGAVRDAAGQFWRERYAFAWVRHTDSPHPHAHLVIRPLGLNGERFRPDRTELAMMREGFALALRHHGVAAEATPRGLRGVTRKSERYVLRKMRERYERGDGSPPRTLEAAYLEASDAVFDPATPRPPWEQQIAETQSKIRGHYLDHAEALAASPDPQDQALAKQVETFVAEMPAADTRRLEIARQLRELADQLKQRAEQNRTLIR